MTRAFAFFSLGLLAAEAWVSDASACAGCRNPSLPSAQASGAPLEAGQLRADATLTGTTVHVVHTAGCEDLGDCDEVPVQPLYLHDQRITPIELRLGLEYGFSENYGVELQFPVRMVASSIEFATPEGAPYEPLDPDVHHRDETLLGPADALLLGRAGRLFAGTWLAVRVGASLPIAQTEPDPFELGDRGLRHQHVQLGTGTFDPALSVEAFRRFEPLSVSAFALGQASLYDNRHGYRAPPRVQAGMEGATTLVSDLDLAVGAGVYHEGAERWQGVVRQDGSLGRTELYLNLGLSYALDETTLKLGARFPVLRRIAEGEEPLGEFSSPLVAYFGVSHTFAP